MHVENTPAPIMIELQGGEKVGKPLLISQVHLRFADQWTILAHEYTYKRSAWVDHKHTQLASPHTQISPQIWHGMQLKLNTQSDVSGVLFQLKVWTGVEWGSTNTTGASVFKISHKNNGRWG